MKESPEDEKRFEILEAYVHRLQTDESVDCEEVLRDHPEMQSTFHLLEVLDQFAPSAPTDTAQGEDTFHLSGTGQILPCAFGRYELLEEIGRGGMGVVYKARQEDLDRTVAVKMILSSHLASPEHVRRFHVEAKIAARLRHPNIVHIHDVGQLHGQHYFAMEYVEGESLAEKLQRESLDSGAAAQLVATITRAVAHLHRQDLVHRDLKPSNIMLDDQGQPYVTDFGLAKVFSGDSSQTATGVIAGTPSYMAPEQAAGRNKEVGPACDVYSLGAILYELLTGRPPFHEENPLDTLVQVLQREPVLPRKLNPKVSRGLELICLKCLAKQPGERYESADALADDLERFSRGEPLSARPPHVGQLMLRWMRRQPALATRLGAMGLFYSVELYNVYVAQTINIADPESADAAFHWRISAIMAVWATLSIVCQRMLDGPRHTIPARLVWGTLDSILLLVVLLVADGAASPLVIAYPLLIVGSGLWFRERFVWYITATSILSYTILIVDFYCWRTWLQDGFDACYDRHVFFLAGLAIMGMGVATLVHRVRALSRYYGASFRQT